MERYLIIGEGRQSGFPYEVGIHWDDPVSQIPRVILLGEGSGHASMGGYFPLSTLLDARWSEHLQICECLWLRDLARQEVMLGRCFGVDEIFELWRSRPGSED